jgi:uncharacterized membrane protein
VVGAGAAPPPQGAGAPPPVAGAAPMADNVAGALCYVLGFITGIIFLVLAPYNQNKTIRFHAFQSIFFSVATIVGSIILSILLGILFGILHMWFVGSSIHLLYSLACLLLWLYLLITTYQGKTTVLPIIGPLAKQQA